MQRTCRPGGGPPVVRQPHLYGSRPSTQPPQYGSRLPAGERCAPSPSALEAGAAATTCSFPGAGPSSPSVSGSTVPPASWRSSSSWCAWRCARSTRRPSAPKSAASAAPAVAAAWGGERESAAHRILASRYVALRMASPVYGAEPRAGDAPKGGAQANRELLLRPAMTQDTDFDAMDVEEEPQPSMAAPHPMDAHGAVAASHGRSLAGGQPVEAGSSSSMAVRPEASDRGQARASGTAAASVGAGPQHLSPAAPPTRCAGLGGSAPPSGDHQPFPPPFQHHQHHPLQPQPRPQSRWRQQPGSSQAAGAAAPPSTEGAADQGLAGRGGNGAPSTVTLRCPTHSCTSAAAEAAAVESLGVGACAAGGGGGCRAPGLQATAGGAGPSAGASGSGAAAGGGPSDGRGASAAHPEQHSGAQQQHQQHQQQATGAHARSPSCDLYDTGASPADLYDNDEPYYAVPTDAVEYQCDNDEASYNSDEAYDNMFNDDDAAGGAGVSGTTPYGRAGYALRWGGASGRSAGASGASGAASLGPSLFGVTPPDPDPDVVSADPWSEDEEEEADTTAEQFYAATNSKAGPGGAGKAGAVPGLAAGGEGTLRQLACWPYEWAVNYATMRPGSHLAAVVGDDPATLLTDVHNGVTVARLEGHRDFSFAAAWHPGGTLLATGNQDTTALLWDVRRTDEPLARLEHDFFGEIAGIAFTPDSASLFIGVADLTYASLMHFERQRCAW
ncbi:WD repeat domain-containing protein [Tetrabaena socialis]|uniref:WD repeat domain-containing protein n=1 Tax=Tetrabaena socialis TaxID=47790 RepID=A0A2J8A4E4_9CHLO|nr:WD repeat domain-containing protein [Tetrabaena socialis]|eukprot:PNH07375.1 WD repeat domain-containing protein [Tetrabaena socialis]